jgi:hypothetical protein
MITRYLATITIALATSAITSSASGQQPPPVRPLGPIVRVSTEPLSSVAAVRQLPDGRVFVNDIVAHRVVLFDSSLARAKVVADSTSATANAYGNRPGGLLAYRGDSTLFVDPQSLSMLVIDPMGRIAHIISVPRPNDIGYLIGGPNGTPGFDSQGRLVYRAAVRATRPTAVAGGPPAPSEPPDSSLIVRVDLATRKLDTLGGFKIAKMAMSVVRDANGNPTGGQMVGNPLPLVDDWAVEADGSVAIIRGRDYHVDWLSPDGTWTSSPKMPFEWEHMDDDRKAAYLDSVRIIAKARVDSQQAAIDNGTAMPQPPVDPSGTRAGDPAVSGGISFYVVHPAGAGDGAGGPPPSGLGQRPRLPPPMFVEARELPDYKPPFFAGATRADADGNLWIRTTRITNGRAIYDIVNRKGELIDRVQLPAFRTIAGFGPGVVYMGVRDAEGVVHLERARVR